jgi:plastocyanin
MKEPMRLTAVAMVIVTAAVGTALLAKGDDNKAPAEVTVHFAMPQPQPAQAGVPGTPDNSSTHFLMPDDVTVRKGGTVTFVVNGGGHGIAIHPVSKDTTRADIAEDLCQGGTDEADRRGRNAVCNGTIINPNVDVNGVPTTVTGTDNLNYTVTDGKGEVIIVSGFNLTATNSAPATIIPNPRLDDTVHTHRLLGTSGRSAGDTTNPAVIANNQAGAFLTGTAFNTTTLVGTPGQRIQVRFDSNGRYLVICMNRSHALNDHMFGFVNVVGEGNDDDK